MIMTPDNQILTTIEDDGKGNDIISIPGGHIDLGENGIQNAMIREFGEEITKSIKINESKLKIVTIRQVPLFPRLGNIYKNQDIWFLYTLELSKSDCNKIISNYKKNGEAKSLQLINLEALTKKVGWLSKDIFTALKCNCDVKVHHSKNAYNNNEGYFFY
jgi:8-oxo-dGTP pyrophosphatase MutT (NUDIX family)